MLPKTAGSAQTHKSISFIWIVWSTLYVYLCVEYANCCKYMPACKTKGIKICTLSMAKLFLPCRKVYAKISILCLLKNPYSLFFMLLEKCLLSIFEVSKNTMAILEAVCSLQYLFYTTLAAVSKIGKKNARAWMSALVFWVNQKRLTPFWLIFNLLYCSA